MYSVNAKDDNEIHSGSDVSQVAADGTTLSSTSNQDDSTEFRGHFIYLEYHLYPNARMEMVLQNVLIKLCLGAKQRWWMDQKNWDVNIETVLMGYSASAKLQ